MSATIRDASDDSRHRLTASRVGGLPLVIFHLGGRNGALGQADMPRADFLAAVETECGVRIVAADVAEALDELKAVDAEVAPLIRQAADIAKAGGITDERLHAMLHLAGTRTMTPTTERILADAGIDTTPWAVLRGEQKVVPADAIVIDRAGLPEVTPSGGCSGVGVHFLSAAGHEIADTSDATLVRVHALALLALTEYLDAHPPVPPVSDEDVETLAGLMGSIVNWPSTSIARRLLATGRVSVTK